MQLQGLSARRPQNDIDPRHGSAHHRLHSLSDCRSIVLNVVKSVVRAGVVRDDMMRGRSLGGRSRERPLPSFFYAKVMAVEIRCAAERLFVERMVIV